MEKVSLPKAEEYQAFVDKYKDSVFYVATKDEKVIVTNDGEWIPKETFNTKLKSKDEKIEALNASIESTSNELAKLKKDFKDVEGVQTTLTKLEEEKSQLEGKLKNTSKIFALKEAYRSLGVKPAYLDFIVSKEHPDLSKVELSEQGEFVIPEEKSKALKESYKEIIGEFKVKGSQPNSGEGEEDDFAKYKKYNLTQKIELKQKDPELYHKVFG